MWRQTWRDLLFLHWRVSGDALRARLPPGLQLDTFEGEAWLGVVPFRMTGVRPRGVPCLPLVSSFRELNVRTYVVRDERPGVYFFSLDASSRLAVAVARRFFHLPYFHARMSLEERDGWIHYASARPGARFRARYREREGAAPAGALDHWLTERYCLYTRDLLRGEVHHAPWPLRPAEAEIEENTMAAEIAPLGGAPLAHFARRLDVWLWPFERT